jgi:cell division protein FtsN
VFEEQKSAETRAEEARVKVGMNVYVEFEPPFYRVRVGDFKTRKEAEQYVKILQNYGFRGAFWVMKQISVP